MYRRVVLGATASGAWLEPDGYPGGVQPFDRLETWLTAVAGGFIDRVGSRFGSKLAVAGGGLLYGLGWVINGYAG